MSKGFFKQAEDLFYPGMNGSKFYRIPALVKSLAGTIIAGADKRVTNQQDWGDINSVIRRKPVGSEEFDESIVAIDLAEAEDNDYAFLIDMALLVQKQGEHQGRIHLLVDMFPNGGSFWAAKNGSGFKDIEGQKYQLLTDKYGHEYTIREGGIVYDAFDNKTLYRVVVEDQQPFHKLGDLYHEDKLLGNVFLDNSPLKIYLTSNIWYTYSDDDAQSFALPKNLTGMVKKEWMRFMGTAPGTGIQLENGRLVFPVYFTDTLNNRQSTSIIYSDDEGETWSLGQSPNDTKYTSSKVGEIEQELTESQVLQLNNGAVLIFMRNHSGKVMYAISYDHAETWEDELQSLGFACEAYCQMSVLHYQHAGEEYILLSNPQGPERKNGSVKLCKVKDEKNIELVNEVYVNHGPYQYSCLAQIGEEDFALLYEEDDVEGKIHLKYLEFTWEDLQG